MFAPAPTETHMPPGAGESPSPHFTSPPNYAEDAGDVEEKMFAVAYGRWKQGQATHYGDLKAFTPTEIGAHWPRVAERLNRLVFRDVAAEDPGYRPHELTKAADIVKAMIPDQVQIGAALSEAGIAPDAQRAMWDALMARAHPKVRALHELTRSPAPRSGQTDDRLGEPRAPEAA